MTHAGGTSTQTVNLVQRNDVVGLRLDLLMLSSARSKHKPKYALTSD